jgi:hypothetical protein
MPNRLFSALTAALLLAAASAAPAGPISGYPAATTPLTGSETTIGTQSGATVQITTGSIAAIPYATAGTFTVPQVFPAPGASKGSIVLTPGTVSGTPPNGSLWTTSGGVFAQVGGATLQLNDAAAGSNNQFQYNCSGVLCGSPNLTFSSGASNFNGTVGLPDTGTLTSALNTFAKPIYLNNATTVGIEVNGNGAQFPCFYSSTTNTGALGTGATVGAGCGTPALTWTGASGSLTFPAGFTNDALSTVFKDQSGANTILIVSYSGAVPHVVVPSGGVYDVGSVGLSYEGAGTVLDIGNGTNGDKSATVNAAILTPTSAVNLPLNSAVNPADQVISTAKASFGVPLELAQSASPSFQQPANQATLQLGGVPSASSGGNMGLTLLSRYQAQYCDQYSSYCMGRQMDFVSNDGFPVFGIESGAEDNHSLEIGQVRDADDPLHMSQLLILDHILPAGAVEHWNVTPGSGYTAPMATISGSGCTLNPSSTGTVITAGTAPNKTVVGLLNVVPGVGCASVSATISDSTGAGATATAVLTSPANALKATPTLLWHNANPGSGAAAFYGIGQCDENSGAGIGPNCLVLGAADNSGFPYDYNSAHQPNLKLPGHVIYATPNGASGFVGGERLGDGGAHVLQVQACTTASADCDGGGFTGAGVQTGFYRMTPTTVAGLATLDPTPADGDSAFVTDATAPTFNGALTGGGTVHTRVHYDGSASAWKAG